MTRILRIELRRSGVAWMGVLLLVAGTWLLYAAPYRWTSGYMILAMDQRWYLSFLTGLAVAAGAWQGRREHRSGVLELFAGVPRPRAQQVAPILTVYGITAFVTYAGAWGLAAVSIVDTAEYLRAGAVAGVLVAGALAMVTAAWFGLAAGRLLPYLATAPLLAVATFATPLVAKGITGNREWLSALLFPSSTLGGPDDFATVPGRFSVAQVLYLTGLAASVALLFAVARKRALLPALLGIIAAVLVLQGGSAFVKEPIDAAARELVCTADTPKVCVARVHSGVLDEVTPPARAALAKLARLPDAPTSAEENIIPQLDIANYPDSMPIPMSIGDDGHVYEAGNLEHIMVSNVGVLPFVCPDESPGTDPVVVNAATAWLLGVDPAQLDLATEDVAPARKVWLQLRKLDEREAAARVSAVRRAVLSCSSGDDLLARPAALR
ncbi:hypothetical protein [Actinoplanes friuliensis]|uniref:Uncharacterized protein n=1 Tax=Actinoplanes friuliensis DSM 7358 TaxID=1246995 RepID=U5VZN2_9ACTN|nr:hypothetical protein [Actinoplanes friuliensis]AGZ41101.1 hypothetical protein AFR_14075 [Actinoplanes friuliensis DSM 7358]